MSASQIIATINPIEAEGVLEELETRLSNLRVKMVRLEAELNGKSVYNVRSMSTAYSKSLVDAEIELMISRRASLNAELNTLVQDRLKTSKSLLSLDAEISGQKVFQRLLSEEMLEVIPLVEAGVLGSSERFRLEREGASTQTKLEVLKKELLDILDCANQGAILRDGLQVAIAGKPNSGKSSLLNALTKQPSAIVTDIAGTTRDVLKETIHVDGMPLHIIDTAGLHKSDNIIEQEGIRRAPVSYTHLTLPTIYSV